MPTNRKYRTKQRRETFQGLTTEIERALKYGRSFFDQPAIDVLRAAWSEHGDDLTERWIEEKPGSRPFAWWLFVAVPEHGERRPTAYWRKHCDQCRDQQVLYGILHTHTIPAMQEPEADYLRRHGYLLDGEAEQL